MGEAKRRGSFESRKKKALELENVSVQSIGDKTSKDGSTLSREDLIDILAPETEPLTDELYQELLDKGFPKIDLDRLRRIGMQYNRARNSLIDPYTDCSVLIEYKQNPSTGKFSLSESRH